MSALIAFEPTQDSEVLVETVEHDGSEFWNPNLYIYGSSDSIHGRIGDAARKWTSVDPHFGPPLHSMKKSLYARNLCGCTHRC
jgi:hypothetical protein